MKCGFHIITISTDEELFPLQDMIYEHTPGGPSINITSANEHVPDIETQIIFVKDKTRAVRHSIHFKNPQDSHNLYCLHSCQYDKLFPSQWRSLFHPKSQDHIFWRDNTLLTTPRAQHFTVLPSAWAWRAQEQSSTTDQRRHLTWTQCKWTKGIMIYES